MPPIGGFPVGVDPEGMQPVQARPATGPGRQFRSRLPPWRWARAALAGSARRPSPQAEAAAGGRRQAGSKTAWPVCACGHGVVRPRTAAIKLGARPSQAHQKSACSAAACAKPWRKPAAQAGRGGHGVCVCLLATPTRVTAVIRQRRQAVHHPVAAHRQLTELHRKNPPEHHRRAACFRGVAAPLTTRLPVQAAQCMRRALCRP